ncbi:MAG: polyprenyl synthetase family protein [Candidatus Sericytochromatia bacterium]
MSRADHQAFLTLRAMLLEIDALLAEVSLDVLHERLLQRVLDKLRSEFMAQKIFPALLAPAMTWRALHQPSDDPRLAVLCAAHMLFYAFLDITDDVEDQELSAPIWRQLGPALAINAGTSLMFLSQLMLQRLSTWGVSAATQQELGQLFMQAGWCLSVGQHRDLSSPRLSEQWRSDDVLNTHLLKTGSSVRLYLESVAVLCETSPELRADLAELGTCLGALVQMLGDWHNLQQPLSSDLANGCAALPLIILQEQVSAADLDTLRVAQASARHEPAAHDIVRHLLKKYAVHSTLNALILNRREQASACLARLHAAGCETGELLGFLKRFRRIHPDGP